jgi:methenyltetrahydrofolate cyclohydrolase
LSSCCKTNPKSEFRTVKQIQNTKPETQNEVSDFDFKISCFPSSSTFIPKVALMLVDKTVTQFLDELASNSPAPGGGSVAALAGAAGAALTSMVCNLTIGKKKYADVQDQMKLVVEQTELLRRELTQLINKDTEAFNAVMAAFGLPKGTEQEQASRSAAIQEATKAATLVPLSVMRTCEKALFHTRTVAQKGNKNSASDAGVAALLLQAGCAGAALNVRINLGGLNDAVFVQETAKQSGDMIKSVEKATREVLADVEKSIGPS